MAIIVNMGIILNTIKMIDNLQKFESLILDVEYEQNFVSQCNSLEFCSYRIKTHQRAHDFKFCFKHISLKLAKIT